MRKQQARERTFKDAHRQKTLKYLENLKLKQSVFHDVSKQRIQMVNE